jgi:hypothetical protein
MNIDTTAFETVLILFAVSFCVAAASWLFGLLEAVGVLRLRDWAFRVGPSVIVRQVPSECPLGLSIASAAETEHLKYRVLEDRRCLFRRKVSLVRIRWNTPLTIKGVISWDDGTVTVKGRCFLSAALLFIAWLAGWTAAGLLYLIAGRYIGAFFIGLGWLFGWGIAALSRSIELRRFATFVKEVQAALGAGFPTVEEA